MRSRSLEEAIEDGREVRKWYRRERGRRAARQFQDALTDARRQIRQFPESGQLIDVGVRRMLIADFPYQLVYRIEPDAVVILAIAHLARGPGSWTDRQ